MGAQVSDSYEEVSSPLENSSSLDTYSETISEDTSPLQVKESLPVEDIIQSCQPPAFEVVLKAGHSVLLGGKNDGDLPTSMAAKQLLTVDQLQEGPPENIFVVEKPANDLPTQNQVENKDKHSSDLTWYCRAQAVAKQSSELGRSSQANDEGRTSNSRKKYIKKKMHWTKDEDESLTAKVKAFGVTAWNRISKLVGKSEIKCHKRWLELSNLSHMATASWSLDEDLTLARLVTENGARNWTKISLSFPGRIGKQCRERWHHHLDPNVVKKKWTLAEDRLILKLYLRFNTRWSEIARHVSGRTDNQIKNRFNSNLKKRMNEPEFAEIVVKHEQKLKDGDDEGDLSLDSVTFDVKKEAEPKEKTVELAPMRMQSIGIQTENESPIQVEKVTLQMQDLSPSPTFPTPSEKKESKPAPANPEENKEVSFVFACQKRRLSKLTFKCGSLSLTPGHPIRLGLEASSSSPEDTNQLGLPLRHESSSNLNEVLQESSPHMGREIKYSTPQQQGRYCSRFAPQSFSALDDDESHAPGSVSRNSSHLKSSNIDATASATYFQANGDNTMAVSLTPSSHKFVTYSPPEKRQKTTSALLTPGKSWPMPTFGPPKEKTSSFNSISELDPCFSRLDQLLGSDCKVGEPEAPMVSWLGQRVLAFQKKVDGSNMAYCVPDILGHAALRGQE